MSDIFAERLKTLRGNRNKAEFSREIGIPAPMYHRYENGQIPKENNLRVISDHCGVTIDWLLGRDDCQSQNELHHRGVVKLEKGQQKQETTENIEHNELHNRGVTKLEKGQGGCRYPEDCDLGGELNQVREQIGNIKDEMAYMRTQLDTVVGLLGAALGNGIRDKQDERKAG